MYVWCDLTCSTMRHQSWQFKSGSGGSSVLLRTLRTGILLTQSYPAAFAALEYAHCSSTEVRRVPRWGATRWCFVDSSREFTETRRKILDRRVNINIDQLGKFEIQNGVTESEGVFLCTRQIIHSRFARTLPRKKEEKRK